jgi:hypothetical protein
MESSDVMAGQGREGKGREGEKAKRDGRKARTQ